MSKKSRTSRRQFLLLGATLVAGGAGYMGYHRLNQEIGAYPKQPHLRAFEPIKYSNNNINITLDEIPTEMFGAETTILGFNKQFMAQSLDLFLNQVYFFNIKNNLREASNIHIYGVWGQYENKLNYAIPAGQTAVYQVDTSNIQPMFTMMRPQVFDNAGRQISLGLSAPIFIKHKPTIPPRKEFFPETLPQHDLFITDLAIDSKGNIKQNDDPYAANQLGDKILINGQLQPKLFLPPQTSARFRITNASLHQYLLFDFGQNNEIWQYGADGGLINQPQLLRDIALAPGARVDVVVHFNESNHLAIMLKQYDNGWGNSLVLNQPIMDIFFVGAVVEKTKLPVKIAENKRLENPTKRFNCEINPSTNGGTKSILIIDGNQYSDFTQPAMIMKHERVNEIVIKNNQNFDITIHFGATFVQLIAADGQNKENTFIANRDIINISPNETVSVLMFPSHFGQFFIYAITLKKEDNEVIAMVSVE